MLALTIVRIITPQAVGSGVFIAPDLVITAAHVLQPHTPVAMPAPWIKVALPDGSTLPASSAICHPGWGVGGTSFDATMDMAVLRVAGGTGQATTVVQGAPAASLKVFVVGIDANLNRVETPGTVTRIAHPRGFDTLVSSDLSFPSGVSGGPICTPDGSAIGIATWSPPGPVPGALVGIPFLSQTLGWLQAHCP